MSAPTCCFQPSLVQKALDYLYYHACSLQSKLSGCQTHMSLHTVASSEPPAYVPSKIRADNTRGRPYIRLTSLASPACTPGGGGQQQ